MLGIRVKASNGMHVVEADAGNIFMLCEDALDDAGSTAVDQGATGCQHRGS
jgi:hypothetical protein